jgi:hypothetical protein
MRLDILDEGFRELETEVTGLGTTEREAGTERENIISKPYTIYLSDLSC